jgi:hypothetical protein
MPSSEYHLRQAEIASRFALAESDPLKATQFHLLALEHFEKAEKAKASNHPSRPLAPSRGRDGGDHTKSAQPQK